MQAKLLYFILTDKQNLCRKHRKEDTKVFCFSQFCFLSGNFFPGKSWDKKGHVLFLLPVLQVWYRPRPWVPSAGFHCTVLCTYLCCWAEFLVFCSKIHFFTGSQDCCPTKPLTWAPSKLSNPCLSSQLAPCLLDKSSCPVSRWFFVSMHMLDRRTFSRHYQGESKQEVWLKQ